MQEACCGEIQHGHMEQVGYDTYCKLLDEVIKEEQGIVVEPEIDIQIDLNVSSFLPDSYISDSSQKIEIYQNIALCRTEENIQDVIDEMIDRFGQLPDEAENLIEIARIKSLAKKNYVTKITQRRESILFFFEPTKFDVDIINNLIKEYRNRIKLSADLIPYITLKVDNMSDMNLLIEIEKFLKKF